MRVITDSAISDGAWISFIDGNMHATPFQSPAFLRFFNSVGGFSAKSYAVQDGGIVKALAVVTVQGEKGPAGLFSRRQIVYGGPLADDNSPDALDMLLKAMDEDVPGGVIYTEIRNLSDYSSLRDVFISNGYVYVPYLNFRVDTRSRETMAGRVSSSRLRQIRKAQQQSVTYSEAQDADEVRQFYLLLKDLYMTRLHKPLPGEDFFVQFFKQDLGKYLLVRHEGQIIGGIMCPVLSEELCTSFIYAEGMMSRVDCTPGRLLPGQPWSMQQVMESPCLISWAQVSLMRSMGYGISRPGSEANWWSMGGILRSGNRYCIKPVRRH